MAYAALVWLHDVVDLTSRNNPLRTGVCRSVVEAAKRNGTQRKNRKLPVSIDMVKRIVANYGKVIRLLLHVQAMPLVQLIWSKGINMSAAKMDMNSSGLLIRQFIFRKNSNSYILGNEGISYSRCREIFLEALKALGYDSKLFGLHSLRSGEATAAVNSLSSPVSDRLLKLHGRWKSDYAKDLCVHEDMSARLSVSSSLGI